MIVCIFPLMLYPYMLKKSKLSHRGERDSSSPVLSLRCSIYRADGTTSFSVPVPDTITTWVASAFAVNPASGLGLTPSPANVSRSYINSSPKTDSLLLN